MLKTTGVSTIKTNVKKFTGEISLRKFISPSNILILSTLIAGVFVIGISSFVIFKSSDFIFRKKVNHSVNL